MKIRTALSGPLMALALCMMHAQARSQDSLFYANGNIVVGQVDEIGLDLIRYRTNSAGNPVLIVVDKHELTRIRLRDGQAYAFGPPVMDGPYSPVFLDRKHAVSIDVLSPALGHISAGYEQVLGHRIILSARVGYIGLWEEERNNDIFNSKGGLVAAGLKFMLPRGAKRIPSVRDTHPLAGWYLRPEIMFSAWTRSYHNYYYYDPYSPDVKTTTSDYTSAALTLNIGRQLLLGERVTFDIWGGFGYGAQWREGKAVAGGYGDTDRQEYAFSHLFFGNVTPLVISGGLRFGYAF